MGPIAQIRAEVEAGATTTGEIAMRTGLPDTLVGAVLQHLHQPPSCGSAPCGGCPLQAGCSRPVLLNLGQAWNNDQK